MSKHNHYRTLAIIVLSSIVLTGCAVRRMNSTVAVPGGSQIVWGAVVNGLQVGLEAKEVKGQPPRFIGHLRNVGTTPLSVIDPRSTEQKWGVVVSLLEETGATASTPALPLKSNLVRVLSPGESTTVDLGYRADIDRVPYTARLRYTYANQIPSTLPGMDTPGAPLWTGEAQSGDVSIEAKFIEVDVYKPSQRFG